VVASIGTRGFTLSMVAIWPSFKLFAYIEMIRPFDHCRSCWSTLWRFQKLLPFLSLFWHDIIQICDFFIILYFFNVIITYYAIVP